MYIYQFCPSTLWALGDPAQVIRFGGSCLNLLGRSPAWISRSFFLLRLFCADHACCLHPIVQVITLVLSPWSGTEFRPQAALVPRGLHHGCAVARGRMAVSQSSQVPAPHPTTSSLSQSRAESQRASSAFCLLPSSCSHPPPPRLPRFRSPPVPWLG